MRSGLSARARKGRSLDGVPVYFLDTDFPENAPDDRAICDRLYGGERENRLRQEISRIRTHVPGGAEFLDEIEKLKPPQGP